MIRVLSAFAILCTTCFAAPIKPAKVDLKRPVDFTKDVLPFLENNCIACHNEAIREGKLSLEDFKSLMAGGKKGAVVVAGKPDESRLYVLAAHAKSPIMPPAKNKVDAEPLTSKELGILRKWIEEGAKAGSTKGERAVTWQKLSPDFKAIYALDLASDGRTAVVARANRISVYDVQSGAVLATLSDPKMDGKTAHRDFVHSVAINHDLSLIASGGYRVVKIWKKDTGGGGAKITAGQPVTATAAAGNLGAFATADGKITLVDFATGKTGKVLTGHKGAVRGVAFDAKGAVFVSTGDDKTLRVWDIKAGKEIASVAAASAGTCVSVSPDGTKVVTGHADNIVRVWDRAGLSKDGAKPQKELKSHSQPITCVAFVPNDNARIVSGSKDARALQWDINSGRATRTFSHGAPISALAINSATGNDQRLATAGTNGTIRLYRLSNGQLVKDLRGDAAAARKVADVEFDQTVTGQRVTIAKNSVTAAEKNLKDREAGLKKAKEQLGTAEKAVPTAKKKADDTSKALAKAKADFDKKPKDNNLKRKFDAADKAATAAMGELKRAEVSVTAAKRNVERSEKALADAKTRVTKSKSEQKVIEETKKSLDTELANVKKSAGSATKPAVSLCFHGNVLVSGHQDGAVRTWESVGGSAIATHSLGSQTISAVACNSEGRILAGCEDKSVRVISQESSWKLVARIGADTEDPMNVKDSPFSDRVTALDFNRAGTLLAIGSGEPSRSGEIAFYDTSSFKLVRALKEPHSDAVTGVAFDYTGKLLASSSADKFVKIHDVATGKFVRSFEGHTNHVLDVAWQADGSTLASAGADNQIKFWNALEGGQRRSTTSNISKQVTAINYLGATGDVVDCGGDARCRFHRSSNGQGYRTFSGGTDYLYAADAVGKDSNTAVVIAGGETGVLHVWEGRTGRQIRKINPPDAKTTTAAR